MKKALMLGAVMLAAGATQSANAAAYGFYTPSGGAYCDGVKFSGTAPATGFHVYDGTYCSYPKAYLGGYKGFVKALAATQMYTFPVSNTAGGATESYVFTFYINPSALTWFLAFESTDYGIPFELLNEGTLVAGKPFAAGGKKLKESAIHAGLVKAGIVLKK